MKYLLCLVFWIVILPTVADGQETKSRKEKVSGYLGLKNVVSVKGLFSPSLRPQKPLNDIESQNFAKLSFNKMIEIDFERVISNRNSISILAGLFKTSMLLKQDFYHFDWSYDMDELVTFYATPPIIDRYVGLNYKIFRKNKGGLAPIGRYLGLHLIRHKYLIDYSGISYLTNDGQSTKEIELKTVTSHISKLELGFSSGLSRAIGTKWHVDLGARFGVLLTPYFFRSLLTDYCVGDDFVNNVEDFVKVRTLRRLSRASLANYYLSIGYMF
jgi:hypothetical protein